MYKLPLPRNFEHSAYNTCTDYFLVEKYFMITKNNIMLHGILEKKTLSVASTFEILPTAPCNLMDPSYKEITAIIK